MRRLALPLLVLSLAACGAPEPTAEPEPTEATVEEATTEAEPTEEPTTEEPTTAETTEPPAEPASPPEQCAADGHVGAIWEAINTAELPDTAMIANVNEFPPLPDAEDQDSTVVQVTVCTVSMTRDDQRAMATDIAAAASEAEGPGIYRMDVELLIPNGGQLVEGRHLFVEDFGSYTWDRDRVAALDTFWQEV